MPRQISEEDRIEFDLRPRLKEADFVKMQEVAHQLRMPINVLARRMQLNALRDIEGNLTEASKYACGNWERDIYSTSEVTH